MAIEKHPPQILARLQAADWSDLSRLPRTKDTGFWLYSISAISGPRFMFNITTPLLKDILSGSGKIAEIVRLMNPLDLYVSAIAEYDSKHDFARKLELGEPMALAMTSFASSQNSWKSLVDDKTNDEKHVVVLDWETPAGQRTAQACFITPAGNMPDKATLIEISMAIYSKHYGVKPKTILDA